jgi:hypothetical protein
MGLRLGLSLTLLAGCSLVTDFGPIGTGGSGAAGGGGSGGGIDAAVDRLGDARPGSEAGVRCTSNAQCDDGSACTVDRCNFATGVCLYSQVQCPAATPMCDRSLGCVACVQASDCVLPDCCSTMRCHNNQCQVTNACAMNGNPGTCCTSLTGACLGCHAICPP